ncbi:unnamed protein product [Echinostoma caproni]|uniref:GAGA-binding transcriptional activator n=1 Tax=Echinostoma caproni TaxID=27848 RepID=A0A183AAY7_9TREM|nr:unnamed protein product [Echinostoma caproni]
MGKPSKLAQTEDVLPGLGVSLNSLGTVNYNFQGNQLRRVAAMMEKYPDIQILFDRQGLATQTTEIKRTCLPSTSVKVRTNNPPVASKSGCIEKRNSVLVSRSINKEDDEIDLGDPLERAAFRRLPTTISAKCKLGAKRKRETNPASPMKANCCSVCKFASNTVDLDDEHYWIQYQKCGQQTQQSCAPYGVEEARISVNCMAALRLAASPFLKIVSLYIQ